jgi:Domain of unknown function (DUF5710)
MPHVGTASLNTTMATGAPARVWLEVPYAEKEAAKRAGARWDLPARRWYAPRPGMEQLQRWRACPDVLPGEDRQFGAGLFVDLVPSSCWFTNARSCVDPRLARHPPGVLLRDASRCPTANPIERVDFSANRATGDREHFEPHPLTAEQIAALCEVLRGHCRGGEGKPLPAYPVYALMVEFAAYNRSARYVWSAPRPRPSEPVTGGSSVRRSRSAPGALCRGRAGWPRRWPTT